MKANKLMIDDWFNFLIDIEGGDTEYDPVNEIYQPMQIVSLTVRGNNNGEVESTEGVTNGIDQLQPIPLTAEILGKNFSFSPYNSEGAIEHYYLLGDYYDVEISEYTDGLWEVVVDDVEMSCLPTWKMYVCHVHELQHALRLCGINKEITI